MVRIIQPTLHGSILRSDSKGRMREGREEERELRRKKRKEKR
jgi:hypothetical protein